MKNLTRLAEKGKDEWREPLWGGQRTGVAHVALEGRELVQEQGQQGGGCLICFETHLIASEPSGRRLSWQAGCWAAPALPDPSPAPCTPRLLPLAPSAFLLLAPSAFLLRGQGKAVSLGRRSRAGEEGAAAWVAALMPVLRAERQGQGRLSPGCLQGAAQQCLSGTVGPHGCGQPHFSSLGPCSDTRQQLHEAERALLCREQPSARPAQGGWHWSPWLLIHAHQASPLVGAAAGGAPCSPP